MNFRQKVESITATNNSLLCVGLDPDIEKLPLHLLTQKDPFFRFNKEVIDATHDLVCVYKPNIAFYEAEGLTGLTSLKKTIEYIHTTYPEIPVLLDAKRGDIGNTAAKYAKGIFEYWKADAVTVFPHLGLDAIKPFLAYKDCMTIVLIKTSNPDSGMFQDLPVNGIPHHLAMSEIIKTWDYENLGIFVGATYPEELKAVRAVFPNRLFLTAGLGTQGGDTEKVVKAGTDKNDSGIMLNVSRSSLYVSTQKDFAQRARAEAIKLRDKINMFRF